LRVIFRCLHTQRLNPKRRPFSRLKKRLFWTGLTERRRRVTFKLFTMLTAFSALSGSRNDFEVDRDLQQRIKALGRSFRASPLACRAVLSAIALAEGEVLASTDSSAVLLLFVRLSAMVQREPEEGDSASRWMAA
jgi:hypothetical protein